MRQYLASGRISHIFNVDVGLDFGVFFLLQNGRSMLSRCFDLSPCTRCSPLEYRHHFYELTSWILCDDVGHFSCSVRIFRTPPSGVESPVFLPVNSQGLWTYAFRLKDRVNNNNNNNSIWGGSVLTGEEPPPHSGELKHALSLAGGPIPAIPPCVVRTPHLHGAPTAEETIKL